MGWRWPANVPSPSRSVCREAPTTDSCRRCFAQAISPSAPRARIGVALSESVRTERAREPVMTVFKARRGMTGSFLMPAPHHDVLPEPAGPPPERTEHGRRGCRHPLHGVWRLPTSISARSRTRPRGFQPVELGNRALDHRQRNAVGFYAARPARAVEVETDRFARPAWPGVIPSCISQRSKGVAWQNAVPELRTRQRIHRADRIGEPKWSRGRSAVFPSLRET